MSKKDRVWTVLSMLEWATDYFEEKRVPNPRLSIEWIIADVLQIRRLDIYLQYDRPFTKEELDEIRPLVKRRARHEPLQYITGVAEFMSCELEVSPDVLIPRMETEQLVELVLEKHHKQASVPVNLLDIGTGSGCIPISIKKKFRNWNCVGIDISEKALNIARRNAQKNDVDVEFFKADLFKLEEYSGTSDTDWDIVISNPPYITEEEKAELEPQVIKYEPEEALFHDHPEDVYKNIISFSSTKKCNLYLECNDKYASRIYDFAASYYDSVELIKDLDGNSRFIHAFKDRV